MSGGRQGTAERAAWDVLPHAYDQLTASHDHATWARQLERLALDAGLTGRQALDVGCGTGASSAAIRDLGYDIVGVDVSAGMLTHAARRLGPSVPLHCLDMRELPRLGEFDSIWCVCDGVNFLLGEDELVAAFTGFRRNLAPAGRVIFDADTLAAFRTLYTSLLVVPGDERIVIFDGRAEAPPGAGDVAEAVVECLTAATPPWWDRARTIHRQRHHSPDVVARALAAAGLDLVAIWGTDGAGGSERPLDEERHNKAVYIAQATAST